MDRDVYTQMYTVQDKHWWFRARRVLIARVLDRFRPDRGRWRRALDIGCGPGVNFELLASLAEDVSGMDISDEAIRLASERYPGVAVFKDSFPLVHHGKTYDLITLLDVLEHIEDDQSGLRSLADLLAPGGIAVITIPAHMSLWSVHDERLHHFRRYTVGELREKVARVPGLRIEKISYFNMLLFPFIVLFRFVKKITKASTDTDLFLPRQWVNTVLERIFSLEAPLIARINVPVGVSIVCIIRKQ